MQLAAKQYKKDFLLTYWTEIINLKFANDIQCWTSFHLLICHWCIFFGEVSIKVFGSFLTYLFLFVSPFIFWITIFYQICLLEIFPSSLCFVFCFSWQCVFQSRSFRFKEVQIKNFLLDCAFDFISKSNHCTKLIKVFSYVIF